MYSSFNGSGRLRCLSSEFSKKISSLGRYDYLALVSDRARRNIIEASEPVHGPAIMRNKNHLIRRKLFCRLLALLVSQQNSSVSLFEPF
jgi:hypothetical protein